MQGPIQKSVSNSARALGRKVNRPVEPELRWGLQLYYDAFHDLDRERSHAMGLVAIPWLSIIRYAEILDLDEDQTERLIAHITEMDRANLKKLSDDQAEREARK